MQAECGRGFLHKRTEPRLLAQLRRIGGGSVQHLQEANEKIGVAMAAPAAPLAPALERELYSIFVAPLIFHIRYLAHQRKSQLRDIFPFFSLPARITFCEYNLLAVLFCYCPLTTRRNL